MRTKLTDAIGGKLRAGATRFPLRLGKGGLIILALLSISCFGASTLRAQQVSLNAVVTFNPGSGLFTYSYSVVNGTANTLAIISFGVSPSGPQTVLSPTAPTGFGISYDPGVGLVSFFEDNDPNTPQTFAPGSTVSPFAFTSRFSPGPSQFEALDTNGTSFRGVTQAPIPEPGSLLLCGLALPFAAFFFWRRRKLSLNSAQIN